MILNTVRLNKELNETKASVTTECNARIKAETDLKEAQDVIGSFMVEKQDFEKQITELKEQVALLTAEKRNGGHGS